MENPRSKTMLEAVKRLKQGDSTYGDPRVNLACAGELKRVFLRYAVRSGRRIGPAEHEAIDQLLTQVARIATGPLLHDDNYTGAVAYAAMAGECAIAGSNEARPIMPGSNGEDETETVTISEQELLNGIETESETNERSVSDHESFRPALSKDNADRGGSRN